MDVKKFQEKIGKLYAEALDEKGMVSAAWVRAFFQEDDLDQRQLRTVCSYLQGKGIAVEGMEELEESETSRQLEEPEQETSETQEQVPLTEEERVYLEEYQELLPKEKELEQRSFWLEALAAGERKAVSELGRLFLPEVLRRCCAAREPGLFLGDLVQEVNVSVLTVLEENLGTVVTVQWVESVIDRGIRMALEEQRQQSFQDEYLVTKVRNLEAAVKELTEDEEDPKLTIGELSALLDMEEEEIRSILKLTGDD